MQNTIGVVYGLYVPTSLHDRIAPCGSLEALGDTMRTLVPPADHAAWEDAYHAALTLHDDLLPGKEVHRLLREALDCLHEHHVVRIHTNMLWLGVGVSVGGWVKDDYAGDVLPSGEAGTPLPLTTIIRKARRTIDRDRKHLLGSVGRLVNKKPQWVLMDATA